MANIKDIIAPVELITEDATLEKNMYECIITGDFATLETEKSTVVFTMMRLRERKWKLRETLDRMRRANEILTIYSEADFDYMAEQIENAKCSLGYYKKRFDVLDGILTNK